jgi:hypothetical protein
MIAPDRLMSLGWVDAEPLEIECNEAGGFRRSFRAPGCLLAIQLQATNHRDHTDYSPKPSRSFEPDFTFSLIELTVTANFSQMNLSDLLIIVGGDRGRVTRI